MKLARRLRLVRPKTATLPPPSRDARIGWQHLVEIEPTDPMETWARMRAQSVLAGERYRDGSTNPGVLTLAQAGDVLRWTVLNA